MIQTDIDERDVPSEITRYPLPTAWRWVTVADAGAKQKNAIVDGPFGSNLKLTDYVEGGPVPVLTTKNLAGNYQHLRFISVEKFEELKRSAVYPGDILVAKIGSCGKTGIYPPQMPPAIIPANLLKVTLNEEFDRKYVFHYFNSRYFQRALKTIIKASAQPAFGVTNFRKLPLPWAPLVEQHAVVAEIEKQFSRLDEAVANLKRVKANLKRYKAAVLKAAVEGRLVPTEAEIAHREGRGYETGAQLLQRIRETRRSQWKGKGKYKEPAEPDATDLPELPEGWAWGTADQVSDKITDGEHLSPDVLPDGIPLLSAKDVRDSGVTFDEAKYVSASDATKFRSRCDPEIDDILIVSRGATIGRACRINVDLKFCLMGSVILMKLHNLVEAKYALTALKAGLILTRLTSVSGSTAQQAIYIRDIRPLPLPLPPLAEQQRIAAEVDRRLSFVNEVEGEVDTNLKRAEQLRQATLMRAFE